MIGFNLCLDRKFFTARRCNDCKQQQPRCRDRLPNSIDNKLRSFVQIGKYFKKRNVARDTFKRSRRSCSRKSLKERIACSERSVLQEMGLLTATTRERTFTPRMRKKSHTAADWFAFEAKASNESANVTNAAFSGIRCSFYGSGSRPGDAFHKGTKWTAAGVSHRCLLSYFHLFAFGIRTA